MDSLVCVEVGFGSAVKMANIRKSGAGPVTSILAQTCKQPIFLVGVSAASDHEFVFKVIRNAQCGTNELQN